MAVLGETTTITSPITRIIYRKGGSGWGLYKTDAGIAKGILSWDPQDGQIVKLTGWWGRSQYNGDEEFSFIAAELDIPTDPRSMLAYAVDITTGLGPARESEIWTAYGEGWQTTSILLERLAGLTPATRDNWKFSLQRIELESAEAQARAWLMQYGCTPNMAGAAWKHWGTATVGTVEGNCYRLADLPNYGFVHVDNGIRQQFGIGDDDPRRADAAVLYVLNRDTGGGDTVVVWGDLEREAGRLGISTCQGAVDRLCEERRVYCLTQTAPDGQNLVALRDDYDNEREIGARFGLSGGGVLA